MEFLWHVKDVVFTFSLNGVYSEKFGGSRVYAKVRYGSGTVVFDILFFFIQPPSCIEPFSVSAQ